MGAIQVPEEQTGYPGLYDCEVYTPDALPIPVVPYRDPEHFVVQYPRRGMFRTTLYTHTIELARQLGYRVDVGAGYYWEQTEDVFGSFVARCEELEQRYRDRGARIVIKGLRNALYGKFGQHERGKEYYLTLDPEDDMTPVIQWDGYPIGNLYFREIHIERPYMMPHWAGWITATARNTLARAAYALGPQGVYYGDNDSLMVDTGVLQAGNLPIGLRYGEWKIVKHYDRLELRGKKRYWGITSEGEIDEYDIKWAGPPKGTLTVSELEKILPGGPPVQSPTYTINRKAVDTIGGRPHKVEVSQTITIPPDFYHEKIPEYFVELPLPPIFSDE
jgi:hypothetical protein